MIGYKHDYPILIKTRLGIHTFFMKREIFVYVLFKHETLESYRIIDHFNVKPFRVKFWDPKYDLILESQKDLQIKKWDEIELIEVKF